MPMMAGRGRKQGEGEPGCEFGLKTVYNPGYHSSSCPYQTIHLPCRLATSPEPAIMDITARQIPCVAGCRTRTPGFPPQAIEGGNLRRPFSVCADCTQRKGDSHDTLCTHSRSCPEKRIHPLYLPEHHRDPGRILLYTCRHLLHSRRPGDHGAGCPEPGHSRLQLSVRHRHDAWHGRLHAVHPGRSQRPDREKRQDLDRHHPSGPRTVRALCALRRFRSRCCCHLAGRRCPDPGRHRHLSALAHAVCTGLSAQLHPSGFHAQRRKSAPRHLGPAGRQLPEHCPGLVFHFSLSYGHVRRHSRHGAFPRDRDPGHAPALLVKEKHPALHKRPARQSCHETGHFPGLSFLRDPGLCRHCHDCSQHHFPETGRQYRCCRLWGDCQRCLCDHRGFQWRCPGNAAADQCRLCRP